MANYPKIGYFFLILLLILEQKHCFYSNLRARIIQERAIACINGTSGSFNLVIKNFLKESKIAA